MGSLMDRLQEDGASAADKVDTLVIAFSNFDTAIRGVEELGVSRSMLLLP